MRREVVCLRDNCPLTAICSERAAVDALWAVTNAVALESQGPAWGRDPRGRLAQSMASAWWRRSHVRKTAPQLMQGPCVLILGCAVALFCCWSTTWSSAPPTSDALTVPLMLGEAARLPLPARNGSRGDLYCDCNVGNVNNMLITCKVCAAFAYAMNRRLVLLPWCEQLGFEALRNTSCVPVSDLFSMAHLSRLVPSLALPVPAANEQARSGVRCGGDGSWLGASQFDEATLEDMAASEGYFPQPACLQPTWKHAWTDRCNGLGGFGLQIARELLLDVALYWTPSDAVDLAVRAVQARIGGPYMAVHVRRSQAWLPSEIALWSRDWPDVALSMEVILLLLAHEAKRCEVCGHRVFIATNSQNTSEMLLLAQSASLLVSRYDGADTASLALSSMQQVVAELTLLGLSHVMLGTPGSTFLENTRHMHSGRGFLPPRTATLCQFRAELPQLWPQCIVSPPGAKPDSVRCPDARAPFWHG